VTARGSRGWTQWLFVAVGLVGALVFGAWAMLPTPGFRDAGGGVDGRVLTPDGAPIRGATVTFGFRSRTKRDTTDARGCFRLHMIHSPNDQKASLGVTHPGMKSWLKTTRGGGDFAAEVRLEPLTTPNASRGSLRVWSRDDVKCRDEQE